MCLVNNIFLSGVLGPYFSDAEIMRAKQEKALAAKAAAAGGAAAAAK
jgi:hypothetical protein